MRLLTNTIESICVNVQLLCIRVQSKHLNGDYMNRLIAELIQPIEIKKEGYPTIFYHSGMLFKVIYTSASHYLVRADDGFTFTLSKEDEHITWRKID